jgi:hypothetical protein
MTRGTASFDPILILLLPRKRATGGQAVERRFDPRIAGITAEKLHGNTIGFVTVRRNPV